MNFLSPSKKLPFPYDTSSLFLLWLSFISVFVAVLMLSGSLALTSMLTVWNNSVSGVVTVQIKPVQENGRPNTEKTLRQMENALIALRDDPAVLEAKPLSSAELKNLLEPWLGNNTDLLNDIPMPRLIDVTLKDGATLDFEALEKKLTKTAPNASIDMHRIWFSRLESLVKFARLLAFSLLFIVFLNASAVVVFGTFTTLDVHRPVIDLLHQIGAKDDYIAKMYAFRTFLFSFVGGIPGLILAVPLVLWVGNKMEQLDSGMLEGAALQTPDWFFLVLLPLIVAGIATLTAFFTVRHIVRKMP